MQAIITILTLLLTQSESLPVTSKALDSNSDQLIWSAWFSSRQHNEEEKSPYTGESRKITAKSIFITPNFNQNVSHCPPGFKIDDNGKCIKVVNINQGKMKPCKLIPLIPYNDLSISIRRHYCDATSELLLAASNNR